MTGSNQSIEDLQRLVDFTMGKWGRVDVLVNSAGHGPRGPVLELGDEEWHTGMEVYFLSAVRPTRRITPFRERIPMQRYGQTEEIAATIAFLATDGGGYITGQNIRVDGGITRAVQLDITNSH